MIYLAHAFLSSRNPDILLGNLIADFVKQDIDQLSPGVQNGVMLHRKIDAFTDNHPIFLESVKRIRSNHRHYSPVLMDVFYDYFLANNFNNYSQENLQEFVIWVNQSMRDTPVHLPDYFNSRIISLDWLLNYQYDDGIMKALNRIDKRTRYSINVEKAMNDFQSLKADLDNDFNCFFPELILFVKSETKELY